MRARCSCLLPLLPLNADLKDKFADATAAVGSDVADEADVKHDEL